MFCEGCGTPVPAEGVFCSKCGLKAGEPAVINVGQRIASSELTARAKIASEDSVAALKLFALDPTGGLAPAFGNLDSQRALGVTAIFVLIFEMCLMFGIHRAMALTQQTASSFNLFGAPISGTIAVDLGKLFLVGLIPFVSLSVALILARQVFRGSGPFEGDLFTAGAALLPCAALLFVSTVLGIANAEVIVVLCLFTVSYTILILFTGCTRIAKISDAGAALAVPLVLLASAYVAKVIVMSMLSSLITA